MLDLLVRGATLVTGDPARPVIRDGAIGVRGNRLAFVCPAAEAPSDAAVARVIDLPERVITPGFVNVHTHAALTMVRGVAEDLGTAPSYTPGIPHGEDLTPDEACAFARLGALEAMLFGSTLVNDTYVHADATLPAMAELGLRVHASPRIHDADLALIAEGRWEHRRDIGERTLGAALAMAERWHARADGRIGVQLAAHAPDTCSDAFLKHVADTARAKGLQVAIHLAQSRGEVEQVRRRSGRTPAELLDEVGLLDDRLIAAHCLFLTDADIERIGRARVNVAHIPKGNATGGMVAPTPRLRAAGANLALGTDNMHADMVEVMRWALAIARIQVGEVAPEWQPADALAMATANGARAMGLAGSLGTLAAGKLADFVAVDFRRAHLTPDTNPLGTLVHTGQGRDVELVVVDGAIVVEGGRPTRVDADAVRREAKRAAESLWHRVR